MIIHYTPDCAQSQLPGSCSNLDVIIRDEMQLFELDEERRITDELLQEAGKRTNLKERKDESCRQ